MGLGVPLGSEAGGAGPPMSRESCFIRACESWGLRGWPGERIFRICALSSADLLRERQVPRHVLAALRLRTARNDKVGGWWPQRLKPAALP